MGCTSSKGETREGAGEGAFNGVGEVVAQTAPPTEEEIATLSTALAAVEDTTVEFVGGNLIPFFKNKVEFARLRKEASPNGELEAILSNLRMDPLYLGKASIRLWENKY